MENQMQGNAQAQIPEEPEFLYRTQGTCSRVIKFDLDDEQRVHGVQFFGGCNGNLKGIASLIEGMPADQVIERCEGTQCGGKSTSCPDQLARALKWAKRERQA